MCRSLSEGLNLMKPQGDSYSKPRLKYPDFTGRDTEDMVKAAVAAEREVCYSIACNKMEEIGDKADIIAMEIRDRGRL